MLDKDQYNQEEYNDYYQQESKGAGIKGSASEESKGKGGIFALLALLILAVGGYFGYTKFMANQTDNTIATTEVRKEEIKAVEVAKPVQSIQVEEKDEETVDLLPRRETVETPTPEESKKEEAKVQSVEESVKEAVTTNQQMSPEEIAKVVQMVMSQINEKADETTNPSKNSDLMSALSGTDVDSVNEDANLEKALSQMDETQETTTINQNTATVNTYNKVNIQDIAGDDELSKLSGQISELIADKKTTTVISTSSQSEKIYTEGLKQEVVTRKNEMRIIIVKKGDTLGKIAKRAYGNEMSFKKIYQANPDILNRPDRIYIGQKLRIPE
jgi:nucleoid-associated protein YgaU